MSDCGCEGSCPVCRLGEVDDHHCGSCGVEFCPECHGVKVHGSGGEIPQCQCDDLGVSEALKTMEPLGHVPEFGASEIYLGVNSDFWVLVTPSTPARYPLDDSGIEPTDGFLHCTGLHMPAEVVTTKVAVAPHIVVKQLEALSGGRRLADLKWYQPPSEWAYNLVDILRGPSS